MVFYLLALKLVFCVMIIFAIRIVVGRTSISYNIIYGFPGCNLCLEALSLLHPRNHEICHLLCVVTIPPSSSSRDMIVSVCHQIVNLAFLCAPFVHSVVMICLHVSLCPPDCELAWSRNHVLLIVVSLVPGTQLDEWRNNLSC